MSPTTLQGHVEPAQVHFDDFDQMGIVHNARYAILLERALMTYWRDNGWHFDPAQSTMGDVILAVREFSISFVAPIRDTKDVLVNFWIEKLGTTSVVYGFRILSQDESTLHAEGRRVQVSIDRATGRPTPFTPQLRAAAESLLL